ncbi:hypothetical protein Tco_0482813, partial [Tanacetum coccineum]
MRWYLGLRNVLPTVDWCGMNSEDGSGGSGDDGHGNDVGTGGRKCSDDSGGGVAAYLVMRASMDGDI